jgi:hypothetical protein
MTKETKNQLRVSMTEKGGAIELLNSYIFSIREIEEANVKLKEVLLGTTDNMKNEI